MFNSASPVNRQPGSTDGRIRCCGVCAEVICNV
jgi:hypothetical protein